MQLTDAAKVRTRTYRHTYIQTTKAHTDCYRTYTHQWPHLTTASCVYGGRGCTEAYIMYMCLKPSAEDLVLARFMLVLIPFQVAPNPSPTCIIRDTKLQLGVNPSAGGGCFITKLYYVLRTIRCHALPLV